MLFTNSGRFGSHQSCLGIFFPFGGLLVLYHGQWDYSTLPSIMSLMWGQVSPCCRSSAILANSSRKPFPQPELYVIDSCVANINVPDCLSPWATVFLWWETVQDMHWLAMQFLFNWNVWNILFPELLLFRFLGEVWAMLLVTLCNFNVKKYF
jgi:hypothetical protein